MTERKIEELAAEALQEAGAEFMNFTIDHVERKPDGTLSIVFSWKSPFRVEVSLDCTPTIRRRKSRPRFSGSCRKSLGRTLSRFLLKDSPND